MPDSQQTKDVTGRESETFVAVCVACGRAMVSVGGEAAAAQGGWRRATDEDGRCEPPTALYISMVCPRCAGRSAGTRAT